MMTSDEFKDKVDGYIALVLDGHLTEDDACDATLDCLTAVAEHDKDRCYDYFVAQWVRTFMKGVAK